MLNSDFEHAWLGCPAGHSISRQRVNKFDKSYLMLHSPSIFSYARAKVESHCPSDSYILDALPRFVRGEFTSASSTPQPCPDTVEITETFATGEEPFKYLDVSERELVYGHHLQTILADLVNTTDQIMKVICDIRLGNKKNKANLDHQAFTNVLNHFLSNKDRLVFVLPAFPFKDQNLFRTEAEAFAPDMAEIALLVKLHCLALAIYQFHSYGADWVLLCDGTAYANIFGVPKEHALRYHQILLEWRNKLNLSGTVSLVNLSDLIDRIDQIPNQDGLQSKIFSCTKASIASQILNIIKDDACPPEFSEAFRVLVRGMRWNLSTKEYKNRIDRRLLWEFVKAGAPSSDLSMIGKSILDEINDRAEVAAIEYSSFNLALRYLDGISMFMPGTIRATIHPKKGQLAVPNLGPVFPWNGVGLLSSISGPDSVSVAPLSDFSKKALIRAVAPGTSLPLYYQAP